ncbi:MAG: hypothetical protein HY060_26835 [Proteobacteria bacterium]|nr:hypothetical protein [Pseudomonadota bacterium]
MVVGIIKKKPSAAAALVSGMIAAAGASQPAAGQGITEERYRALYDSAFGAVYAKPDDLQAVLEFAKIALLAGDLEGAIGALERVLIFNPNLAEVQFQLGQLYRALGSYDAARLYFLRADPAQLPEEDRAVRAQALAALEAATARHRLNGIVSTGLRYQTNANTGPTDVARAFGASLTPTSGPRVDTNAFAGAVVGHSYDLGDQEGTTWESRATMYATRQFHRHSLNIALLELDTGPRVRLADAAAGNPTFRPYVLGNAFEFGGSLYFSTVGGGGNTTWQPASNWFLDSTFEVRELDYNNTASQSSASNKDGTQELLRLAVSYAPTNRDLITASVQGANYGARRRFETYQEASVSTSYTYRFPPPWTWSEQPWALTAAAGYVSRSYDGGDPSATPMVPPPLPPARPLRRVDAEWDLGGALTIGLANGVAFRFDVLQIWATSNVALYDYRNTAVLGTLELRF